MMFLPKQFIVALKRAAVVSVIALATNSTPNRAADLMPVPALPVATMQAPKKFRLAGGSTSATDAALADEPPIG